MKFGLAMSPINSNRLFLTFSNLFGKYLYYTIDGGANWTQTSNMDKQNADGWVAGSIFGWTANLSGVMDTSAPLALHPTNQNIALTSGYGDSVKKDRRRRRHMGIFQYRIYRLIDRDDFRPFSNRMGCSEF